MNKVRPPEEIKDTITDLEKKVKKCMTRIDKINNKDDTDDEKVNEIAEEFDIDDVYVNDKIKIEIWHGYIRFLETLHQILQAGIDRFKLEGWRSGMFIRNAYKAALRYANKDIKKKFWLKNLWNRQGHFDSIPATTTYVRKINDFI